MANVFMGVPALQGPPDISNALKMLSDGLEERRQRQSDQAKLELTKTIGGKVASGDYQGAEGLAFGSGDMATGLKVHELSLEGQKQFAQTVERVAVSADTPEKWDALRGRLTQLTGQDPGDFETGRPSILSEVSNVDTILKVQRKDEPPAPPSGYRAATDGSLEPIPGGPADRPSVAVPAGYRQKQDGSLEPVPGGPADPNTIKQQATARTSASTGRPDQLQRKNTQLYQVVAPELEVVKKNFPELASLTNQAKAMMPGGNFLLSSGYQEARNSVQTIIASYLYSVSGQTANPGEVATQTEILMPKPGDGKETVANKLKRLETMVDSIKNGGEIIAGPAAAPESPVVDENNPPTGVDPEDWKFMTPEERALWQ